MFAANTYVTGVHTRRAHNILFFVSPLALVSFIFGSFGALETDYVLFYTSAPIPNANTNEIRGIVLYVILNCFKYILRY